MRITFIFCTPEHNRAFSWGLAQTLNERRHFRVRVRAISMLFVLLVAFFASLSSSTAMPNLAPRQVSSGNMSFTYDTSFATSVSVEQLPEQSGEDLGFWEKYPAHVRFHFQNYPVFNGIGPTIYVMPVNEYRDINSSAGDAIDTLSEILRRQNPLSAVEFMPMLPVINAGPMFVSKYQFVPFASGKGVRFVTALGQDLGLYPLESIDLMYVYEGLTADGRYLVAAWMPLEASTQSPAFPPGDPQDPDVIMRYWQTVEDKLNSVADARYNPNISALDAMMRSVNIGGGQIVPTPTTSIPITGGLGKPVGTEFAHSAFERLWYRTDALLAGNAVTRSWFWGPGPSAAAQEQYIDAPSGTQARLVQYFDKSRMEINNPSGDSNSPFFVTNGLLTVELISGKMQIGDTTFVNRFAANIPLASDLDDTNAPTYRSFQSVSNTQLGNHSQPNRTGQASTGTINRDGIVGSDPSKANLAEAIIAHYENQHNIPTIFWQFLNQAGPVYDKPQNRTYNSQLIEPWFFATGLPISDAFWARVKIAGQYRDTLVQAYERRVLTYTPGNPPGFEVQMGNIGAHYYDWRYKDRGK